MPIAHVACCAKVLIVNRNIECKHLKIFQSKIVLIIGDGQMRNTFFHSRKQLVEYKAVICLQLISENC